MTWLHLLTLAGWLAVVLVASSVRGRPFATMAGVLVGVYSLLALAMAPLFHAVMPAFVALHVAVYVNFALLARPRMRPLAYRWLVSWPASFFVAGTLLALPWALARAFGFHPWAPWLPYALGAVGLLQSLTAREEEIDLVIGGPERRADGRSRTRAATRASSGRSASCRSPIRTSARSCPSSACGASPRAPSRRARTSSS